MQDKGPYTGQVGTRYNGAIFFFIIFQPNKIINQAEIAQNRKSPLTHFVSSEPCMVVQTGIEEGNTGHTLKALESRWYLPSLGQAQSTQRACPRLEPAEKYITTTNHHLCKPTNM